MSKKEEIPVLPVGKMNVLLNDKSDSKKKK